MSVEAPSERAAREILEGWNLRVRRIEEAEGEKRADYLVDDKPLRHLIEVKEKLDAPEFGRRLLSGEIVERMDRRVRDNTMSGIIRNAERQLQATPTELPASKIVWVCAAGHDPQLQYDKMKATLYGIQMVMPLEQSFDDGATCIDAYFFETSEFFRRPEIDAVVLTMTDRGQLCLNPWSPNLAALRRSGLARSFGPGVIDPAEGEQLGYIYVVDGDVDRRHPPAVLRFLEEKYRCGRLMLFQPATYSASAIVPRD